MNMERCIELEPPATNSCEVDFKDVFGGPPRRFSMHETRRSFDAVASFRSSWPGPNEKPVFGEHTVRPRRYPSDDFYDDIFRGSDDSSRRSSTPGSRVLSPVHPSLPFKIEPFGSTSVPAQLSLPTKMTKAMDLPAFSSGNLSPYRYQEGTSNTHTPNTPLSRFSSEAMQGQDDGRNNVRQYNGRSLLSQELSLSTVESSYTSKSTGKENPTSSSQFHFSIYKWAGRGVPLLMSLRGGKSPTLRGSSNIQECSSAKGKIESDTKVSEVSTVNVQDFESLLLHDDLTAANVYFEVEGEKQNETNGKNIIESCQIVEEMALKRPKSMSFESTQTASIKDRGEIKTSSLPEIGLSGGIEKELAMVKQNANEPEFKPLRSLVHDEIEEGDEEIVKKAEGKENVERKTGLSHSNVGSTSVKKREGKKMNTKNVEVNKSNVGSPKKSGENLEKSIVEGKIKEFVKIFNQEAPPQTNTNEVAQTRSTRWKTTCIHKTDSEVSVVTTELDSKMPVVNVKKMPDASFTVEESNTKSEKQQSAQKTTIPKSRDNCSGKTDASPFSGPIPGSKVTLENIDDPFLENFQVKELSLDEDKLSQTEEEAEAIRALDSKIQLWSNGRKGNIRSLLSTLQYVLWPESGWKPVALVDIIEVNAVKRSYQRALLCLHPDKIQQKGAASHQKYMAEKVFDILQEAWDHFNSLM